MSEKIKKMVCCDVNKINIGIEISDEKQKHVF